MRKGNIFIKGAAHVWIFEQDFFGKQKENWQKLFDKKLLVSFLIKGLIKILKQYSIRPPSNIFDCTLAAWLAESTRKNEGVLDEPTEIINKLPALYDEVWELMVQVDPNFGGGIPKGMPTPKATNVVIEGDQATASVLGSSSRFSRLDGRWYMRQKTSGR